MVNHVVEPTPSYFDPLTHTHSDVDLDLGLENLYRLESLGIDEKSNQGSIDSIFIQKFEDGICFQEGKYHVELPWYENILKEVPSNYKVALAALHRVKKNLEGRGLASAYGDIFRQYLKEGIIEQIQVSYKDFHKYIWIPHRPIIKTQAQVTTKIRPVFNCSLKIGDSPSLNQASYPGIDLLASLFRLLLQFRTNKFVVMADISKAFLQIRLKLERDRNLFCFFWQEGEELLTFRYTSIIFGLAVSPYVLCAVIKHHALKYPSDLCSSLLINNLYMDNFLYTCSSVEEMKIVFQQTTSRLREGGFDLCSWSSNNRELRGIFQQENKISSHQCQEERVLGYLFQVDSDTFSLSDFKLGEVTTKRQLLSEVAKVFDPLSLFLPVTIRGRLLVKKTWEQEIDWDEEVDQDLRKAWGKLRQDLESLKTLKFPRSCFETNETDSSIDLFCDASTQCYGFVAYITSESNGSNILWSKGKVAPSKGKTLPMLELLSVYLALKCLPQVLSSFSSTRFREVRIFSDSQISLAWLLYGGKKNKSIFVRNRIQDIRLMTDALRKDHSLLSTFHYVKSEENPADLLTRGISLKEFNKKYQLWSHGPEWLSSNPTYWPKTVCEYLEKGVSIPSSSTPVFSVISESRSPPVVDFSRFSSYRSLIRVCSLLYRFSAANRDHLVCDRKARLYCLKVMQKESFSKEFEFLEKVREKQSNTIRPPDLVNHLNLFIDDEGLIRSKGRLSRSNYYEYDVINPILMGKKHHLTHLLIRQAHFDCKHLGIQATLTNLRLKGFWITSARTTIKRVLSECIVCKKFNNFAFQYPRFTNFSKAQVDLFRPFRHVGLDFTKHWWVKVKGSPTSQKMFILIYTCMHVRAIYLDLVPDMSTQSFVQSFQRFVVKFGVPDVLYSDNARSFIQGTDAIESFVVSENGSEFLRRNQIEHKRIPLYSPWVGSLWERMIRVVKDCLLKTIGRSSLEYFDFVTTLSEIADAINSRPLTYTSSDDEMMPITPNCFLKPCSKTSMALPGTGSNNPFWNSTSSARNALLTSLRKSSERFEDFRTRWYHEYLLSLRESSRDMYQAKWDNLIKVDDVVLIKSPVKERPYWQMGIVTQLIHGDDGRVRTVSVKTPGGQSNLYPIKVLYPLELSITHSGKDNRSDHTVPSSASQPLSDPTVPTTVTNPSCPKPRRPVRVAAARARGMLLQKSSSEEESESD
ncbi:UNVERIFIED_CONTAM: hypothetical protein RMT77_018057 [Armadillidium vulgare]